MAQNRIAYYSSSALRSRCSCVTQRARADTVNQIFDARNHLRQAAVKTPESKRSLVAPGLDLGDAGTGIQSVGDIDADAIRCVGREVNSTFN